MEITILAIIYKKVINLFNFINKMNKLIMRIKDI